MISWALGGVAARHWLLAGLVSVACFAVYGSSIASGAFQYDDLHSIVGNTQLHSLTKIPSYFTDPGTFSTLTFGGMFRPLLLSSYALTNAVAGESPAAYHLGNVLIHAVVGGLVTFLLLRLRAGGPAAFLGGLWFVAHPVNTEVAAYVSSRSESLCTLFLLLTMYLWIGGASGGSRDWRTVAGPFVFALALLTKSVGIILPAVLLIHDLVHRQMVWQVARQVAWKDAGWWRSALRRHGPFWLVAGLYLLMVSENLGRALLANPVRGPAAQVWTQAKALIYYLRLLVMPRGLSVEPAFRVSDSLWEGAVLVSVLVLASAVVLVLWLATRTRLSSGLSSSMGSAGPAAFWIAWMPLVLLPTLIVPLNVLVNDHRLYPVTIAAAVLVIRIMRMTPPAWGVPALIAVTLCFSVLSFQRSQVWGDAMTLWSDARDKAPRMPRPYLFVGDGHFQAGRYDAALAAYAEAEGVQPHQLTPGDRLALHNNRGATLLALGRTEEARRSYTAALRIVPDYAPAVEGLAGLQALTDAAARNTAAEALTRRGLAAMVSGDLVLAEEALTASLDGQENDQTRLALGLVLERRQKWQEAAQLYRGLIETGTSPAAVATARRRLTNLVGAGVTQ